MKAFRWILLAVAAVLLPSCGGRHEQWLWVTVRNHGGESVHIWSEAEYVGPVSDGMEHVELSAAPGETVLFDFRFEDLNRLNVRIHRSSDHHEIFDETWDRNELERLDERVIITVSP